MAGNPDEVNVSYDPEEYLISKVVDPAFKTKDQHEMETLSGIAVREFKKQRDQGIIYDEEVKPTDDSNPVQPGGIILPSEEDLEEEAEEAGEVTGGLAIAPLIPIVSAVAPTLINLVSKGISWLVKKIKGQGVHPSNLYSMGRGRYSNKDLYWGKGEIKRAIAKYIPDIIEEENNIRALRGKKFWRALFKASKLFTQHIFKTEFGMTQDEVKLAYRAAFRNMFPNSLLKFMKTSKEVGGTGEKTTESHLRSIVRPIAFWALNKALTDKVSGKGIDRAQLNSLLNKELSFLDTKYGTGDGKKKIGNFWHKVKQFIRKAAKHILPVVGKIAKDEAPGAIKGLLDKINVSDENHGWIDLAKDLVDKVDEKLPAPELDASQQKIADVAKKVIKVVATKAPVAAAAGSGRARNAQGRFVAATSRASVKVGTGSKKRSLTIHHGGANHPWHVKLL